MMRFASLGSGSRGNALVVEAGRTRVLVDCGFGPRELTKRLGRLGLAPGDMDAILVTHEHSDHVGGVVRCSARFGLRVMMTHGTASACSGIDDLAVRVFDGHAPFVVGDLKVLPFPVPHDAREPVQFVFSDGVRRLGVVTDAGHVTSHMIERLSALDALMVECNHDAGMLAAGNYPWPLKQRIAGRFGHLDNAAAADLLRRVDTARLQHVVCAHLSEHNNRPQMAREAVAGALGCAVEWVGVASQDGGCDWLSLAGSQ
jgi:phosphoribosyl 1,2-cyclic phosphodiesterase